MSKWEREMSAAKMAAERRRDIEIASEVQARDYEIVRLTGFLKKIAEPLPFEALVRGDFREISQLLSERVSIAGAALGGAKLKEKSDAAAGIRAPVLHVIDRQVEQPAAPASLPEGDTVAEAPRPDAEGEGLPGDDGA
jgi:hypothetical protein